MLLLEYLPSKDIQEKSLAIVFLPTGDIDFTSTSVADYDTANALLAASISALKAQFNITVDFWRMMNWLFTTKFLLDLPFRSVPNISNNVQHFPIVVRFRSPRAVLPPSPIRPQTICLSTRLSSIYTPRSSKTRLHRLLIAPRA